MKRKTILLSAILLIAFIFLGFFGSGFLNRNKVSSTEQLSNHLEVAYLKSGYLRLRDIVTGKFVTEKFDKIYFWDDDSLAVFVKEGLRGYLSTNTGKVIISPTYTHAWKFSEGLACVTDSLNQLGVINRHGQIVVPHKYKYIELSCCLVGTIDYVFHSGYCYITNGSLVGLIDTIGTEVLLPIYQDIYEESNKYYITRMNGKWGLYDSTFTMILDHSFDDIKVVEDGFSVAKDREFILLASDGKTTISKKVFFECYPLEFINEMSQEYENSESDNNIEIINNVCEGWTVIGNGHGYGLMRDSDQFILIPCRYSEIKAISNNLFRCMLDSDDNKYIIINRSGKIIQ